MKIQELCRIVVMLENLDMWEGYEVANMEFDEDGDINFTMIGGGQTYRTNSTDIESEFFNDFGYIYGNFKG